MLPVYFYLNVFSFHNAVQTFFIFEINNNIYMLEWALIVSWYVFKCILCVKKEENVKRMEEIYCHTLTL